ncbi:hypothetical protein HYS84_03080 [Candidatus Saccharibacteria bacterium]|nr:hypothetical protein [Candidatus Saccharibacteria bacterium]
MATLAIAASPQVLVYPKQVKHDRRRRSRRDRGRFVSKTVRERNERAVRPWWQPSHARKKFGSPRSAELAAALRDELDPDEQLLLGEDRDDISEYLTERAGEDARELTKRHARRQVAIIADGMSQERWARQVLRQPKFLAADVMKLASDPEVGDFHLAVELGLNDLLVSNQLIAT